MYEIFTCAESSSNSIISDICCGWGILDDNVFDCGDGFAGILIKLFMLMLFINKFVLIKLSTLFKHSSYCLLYMFVLWICGMKYRIVK